MADGLSYDRLAGASSAADTTSAQRLSRSLRGTWLSLRAAGQTKVMLLFTVCLALLMIAASWWSAPLPQVVFGHDLICALDGAWKWHWNVRPHVDYYSPSGPLSYLLVDSGLHLSGSLVMAMPTAICLVALLLLP